MGPGHFTQRFIRLGARPFAQPPLPAQLSAGDAVGQSPEQPGDQGSDRNQDGGFGEMQVWPNRFGEPARLQAIPGQAGGHCDQQGKEGNPAHEVVSSRASKVVDSAAARGNRVGLLRAVRPGRPI